jgi:hypothetical protein
MAISRPAALLLRQSCFDGWHSRPRLWKLHDRLWQLARIDNTNLDVFLVHRVDHQQLIPIGVAVGVVVSVFLVPSVDAAGGVSSDKLILLVEYVAVVRERDQHVFAVKQNVIVISHDIVPSVRNTSDKGPRQRVREVGGTSSGSWWAADRSTFLLYRRST